MVSGFSKIETEQGSGLHITVNDPSSFITVIDSARKNAVIVCMDRFVGEITGSTAGGKSCVASGHGIGGGVGSSPKFGLKARLSSPDHPIINRIRLPIRVRMRRIAGIFPIVALPFEFRAFE